METKLGRFNSIKTADEKNAENCSSEKICLPKNVVIPMQMHIGVICEPCVKVGQTLKVGDLIGDSKEFFSVPIHSSVSGIVSDIKPFLHPNGQLVNAVKIETDGKQIYSDRLELPHLSNNYSFLKSVRNSGLVGLGGAGFPTHVKLSSQKINTLLINAAECEPYITTDYREILENAESIFDGIQLLKKQLSLERILIGIEDNKPKAIEKLESMLKEDSHIKLFVLKSKYPQGSEKMLIKSIVNKELPFGKHPTELGLLVMNISSVSVLSKYFKTGIPLVERRITVDGNAIKSPANLLVPIGTSLTDLFEHCGGFTENSVHVIMGGPFMGISQSSLDVPIIKQTNAILALKSSRKRNQSPCIRCGSCVRSCPMRLLPLYIHKSFGNYEELLRYDIQNCIECGCCSYVCPSKIDFISSIKQSKHQLKGGIFDGK